MSDDAWDADGFESKGAKTTDKWEGEDEEDDVKDDWDADSEEEKSKSEAAAAAAEKLKDPAEHKKKKRLRDRVAILEAQANEGDDNEQESSTAEAKLAERLRLQKLEEANQLALTRDMLGLKTGSVDSMIPSTSEDFDAFAKAVCEKIRMFSSSEHYPDMLEAIVKDLTLDMTLATLKKAKIHIEGLHSTRLKEEKATKSKKKGTGRSTLKNDLDKDLFSGGGVDHYDEVDDFM